MSANPIILSRGLDFCRGKSVAKRQPGHRVVLNLDPRVAWEAILLNGLERIPTARRQEWLRGLLVQGFRSECLALRGAGEKKAQRSNAMFTQWLAGEATRLVAVKADRLTPSVSRATPGRKPFAALSRVMG